MRLVLTRGTDGSRSTLPSARLVTLERQFDTVEQSCEAAIEAAGIACHLGEACEPERRLVASHEALDVRDTPVPRCC